MLKRHDPSRSVADWLATVVGRMWRIRPRKAGGYLVRVRQDTTGDWVSSRSLHLFHFYSLSGFCLFLAAKRNSI
jgi:hypothetical protein